MAERKVKIPSPIDPKQMIEGSEVSVAESTERWSEVTLQDGTIIRIKPNVMSAVRLDGQYDKEGNPFYAIKAAHIVTIVSVPDHLRRDNKDAKVQ